ncbi:predicted protein [Phaeodactylum tricornutum CCAP 1055/1]|uniref:Uncharacterized protein n=1 Tax=Phaeodactylum tricornutum (strain CCAP 1055/1) TaxID=556484 RepID=B7FWQ5_PHATC|nr:predicted protein [Phaeodactylum tricornutum CCAP 1055/1]EEC49243.1 predicted protein [Phaeodactylum tricornutum CCAP 1055/1]|eukprot:XP_002179420.1 predicted protein [Phaeodactylum tricornutum CCAP 1055/1]
MYRYFHFCSTPGPITIEIRESQGRRRFIEANTASNGTSSTMATRVFWRFHARLTRPCRVVYAGPHFQAGLSYTQALVRERGLEQCVELVHAPTDAQLWELAPTVDVAVPFMQSFRADFIERASRMRLIMQYGVGLEGVDVDSATKHGIAVSNIPAAGTGNAEATAEHAIFLSLSLLRRAFQDLPQRFQGRILGGLPIPKSLFQKNVTVVGYGAVGSKICEYLNAMGAKVTVVRKHWTVEPERGIHKARSLGECLPTTDLLILACPLTTETFHMLNEETLSLLPRQGSLVVNIGRGPRVEHSAVWRALNSGRVGGYASDVGVGHPVKPSEPWDPDDDLSRHANVLFTPHVGGYTYYSYNLMCKAVVDAIDDVRCGRPPDMGKFQVEVD